MAATLLSFDQAFGRTLGGWLRLGWQRDDAAIDYKAIYSGGLDLKGHPGGGRRIISGWGTPT